MSEATVIKPDLQFVNELINNGGESLKKCYQCATCSVVCNVTPEGNPFPRKEMVLAQWGQKDKLVNSPDIWLCHQCSDCTAYCPRGAKPGEVINAIRKVSIRENAMIPFFANVAMDSKLIWLMFLIPIAIIFGIMQMVHPHEAASLSSGTYHMFIPYGSNMPAPAPIKWIFGLTALFSALSAFVGVNKLWSGMKKQASGLMSGDSLGGDISSSVATIFAHSKFADCTVNRLRQWGHMLLFYSFAVLGVAGILAVVGLPTEVCHYISQAGMIMFLAGVAIVLYNRFAQAGKAGMGSYFDWIFLTIIGGIGVSGLLALLLRLAGIGVGYVAFGFHLIFVWMLLAYAPYSKFAHLFYRTTAMVFAKHTGRK